jgi:hypothetical protein
MELTHVLQAAATITIWHYFKSAKCYTRSLANPTRVGMLFLKRQFSKVCIDSFGGGTRLWNRRIAAFFFYTLRH